MDSGSFTWRDFDGEKGHMTINIDEITALNLDDTNTALTALRSAMNDLTLAPVEKASLSDVGWDTTVVVTDPYAQREHKWRIIVRDTEGNEYRGNDIPLAKLAILTSNNKYIIKDGTVQSNLSAPNQTLVTTFKDAYEAIAKGNTGLSLTIWHMYQAGSNT